MLDTATEGTFMGKQVKVATKLQDDMQENHDQGHVKRSSSPRTSVLLRSWRSCSPQLNGSVPV
jgi:hypothetical protein